MSWSCHACGTAAPTCNDDDAGKRRRISGTDPRMHCTSAGVGTCRGRYSDKSHAVKNVLGAWQHQLPLSRYVFTPMMLCSLGLAESVASQPYCMYSLSVDGFPASTRYYYSGRRMEQRGTIVCARACTCTCTCVCACACACRHRHRHRAAWPAPVVPAYTQRNALSKISATEPPHAVPCAAKFRPRRPCGTAQGPEGLACKAPRPHHLRL